MVTEVTDGIIVSIHTKYHGRFISARGPYYYHSMEVTIENKGQNPIQLLGKHWFYYDMHPLPSEVEGLGLIGQQPILEPGKKHVFSSACITLSSFAAMRGNFSAIDFQSKNQISIALPKIDFFATPRLN